VKVEYWTFMLAVARKRRAVTGWLSRQGSVVAVRSIGGNGGGRCRVRCCGCTSTAAGGAVETARARVQTPRLRARSVPAQSHHLPPTTGVQLVLSYLRLAANVEPTVEHVARCA